MIMDGNLHRNEGYGKGSGGGGGEISVSQVSAG